MPEARDNPFAQPLPFQAPSTSSQYAGALSDDEEEQRPASSAWGGASHGAWGRGGATASVATVPVANADAKAHAGGLVTPAQQRLHAQEQRFAARAAPAGLRRARPVPLELQGGSSPSKKQQLDAKERALAAKEAELKSWEANLRSQGGTVKPRKNWPRFCPMTYHDIDAEVPADLQGVVRRAYWAYLLMAACMLWNLFGSTMALCIIGAADGRLTGWFLAIIYAVTGIPLGWWLWYRRLYLAAKSDRALAYALFFLFLAVHIAFCLWSAVSPPLPGTNDWSHTGFLGCIKAFKANKFVGACFLIGGVAWSTESLLSLWVLKQTYSSFRGGGGEQRLRREVAGAVATNAARHAASQV